MLLAGLLTLDTANAGPALPAMTSGVVLIDSVPKLNLPVQWDSDGGFLSLLGMLLEGVAPPAQTPATRPAAKTDSGAEADVFPTTSRGKESHNPAESDCAASGPSPRGIEAVDVLRPLEPSQAVDSHPEGGLEPPLDQPVRPREAWVAAVPGLATKDSIQGEGTLENDRRRNTPAAAQEQTRESLDSGVELSKLGNVLPLPVVQAPAVQRLVVQDSVAQDSVVQETLAPAAYVCPFPLPVPGALPEKAAPAVEVQPADGVPPETTAPRSSQAEVTPAPSVAETRPVVGPNTDDPPSAVSLRVPFDPQPVRDLAFALRLRRTEHRDSELQPLRLRDTLAMRAAEKATSRAISPSEPLIKMEIPPDANAKAAPASVVGATRVQDPRKDPTPEDPPSRTSEISRAGIREASQAEMRESLPAEVQRSAQPTVPKEGKAKFVLPDLRLSRTIQRALLREPQTAGSGESLVLEEGAEIEPARIWVPPATSASETGLSAGQSPDTLPRAERPARPAAKIEKALPNEAVRVEGRAVMISAPAGGMAALPAWQVQPPQHALGPEVASPGVKPIGPGPERSDGGPVRRVTLKLSEPESDRRVRIDLAERSGRLHVAVRSGDGALTTALRRDLGELVTRLEHAGYDSEVRSPGVAGGETYGDDRLAAGRQDAPPDSGADERGCRSQPEWMEETRPKKNHRVEESFLWHLQSLR